MGKITRLISGLYNSVLYYNANRDKSVWVFGEWFGEKCNDNCLYLANYIAKRHPFINLIWVSKKGTDTSALDSTISVRYFDEDETVHTLKTAGVIIMNQEFLDFSSKGVNYFTGAITINLWHGLIWKKIGFDGRKKTSLPAKIYHNFEIKYENAKYWVAPSAEYEGHISTAYLVKRRNIIHAGYPRNSVLYNSKWNIENKTNVYNKIQAASGGDYIGKTTRIIAYMPTFRDNTNEVFSFLSIDDKQYNLLSKLLEAKDAVIIEKSHYITDKRKKGLPTAVGRIIRLDNISATELLSASDILISDYSSCFFDYLILNRPIIHFIYDYDYYVNNDRGVYYSKEDVACGRTPENVKELIAAIESYLDNPKLDEDLRKQQRKRFWEYDTENTCERIYQEIRRIQGEHK